MANKVLTLTPYSEAKKPLSLSVGPQRIAVDKILLRKGETTRPLNAEHVLEMAKSISVLGLLQPIVIDTNGHLLAGAHRLLAFQIMSMSDANERRKHVERLIAKSDKALTESIPALLDEFASIQPTSLCAQQCKSGISVSVIDVSGKDDGNRSLAVELGENTVRRSYTGDEIRELAKRLKNAGYKTEAGRPKKGEISALSVLEAAVGKSKRTIERIIDGKSKPRGSRKSKWEEVHHALIRAAERFVKLGEKRSGKTDVKMTEEAARLLKAIAKPG